MNQNNNQSQKTYKYFFLNRPPGIGCQPEGHTHLETWIPKQHPEEFPRGAWGYALYPAPLSLLDIWKKELYPANPLEKAVYLAWEDCNKDSRQAAIFLIEYWFLPGQELTYLAPNDFTAQDVLEAKQAGYTWPDVEAALGVEIEAGVYQRLGIVQEEDHG